MATVVSLESLRRSPTASLFEGGAEIGVSVVVTAYERGHGPDLHMHPYPEVFLVLSGKARFTIADEHVLVPAGHVTVVPAQTPHGFKSASDDTLGVVSVHPRGAVEQTQL